MHGDCEASGQGDEKKMKPIIRKFNSGMNDTERKFADRLFLLKCAGEIIDYRFEPVKFMLIGNIEGGHNAVTYTPDFMIVHPDHFEYVDVKARGKLKSVTTKSGKLRKKQWSSMEDDARVKINIVAGLHPWYEWSVYYFEQGQWIKESVSGEMGKTV
jgi:hypothetical protein